MDAEGDVSDKSDGADMQNMDPNDGHNAALEEGTLQHAEQQQGSPETAGALQQEAAGPSKQRGRPTSSNQRLKREFRSRKSLAGMPLTTSSWIVAQLH